MLKQDDLMTLDRQKPVIFIGCMNAMPMMYARVLKRLGYNVIFFVDAPRANALCRPENHFPDIDYPYPNWIHELKIPSQILAGVAPKIFARRLKRCVKTIAGMGAGAYFLNGFNTSLIPYLEADTIKIALSHGSDLDTWADVGKQAELSKSFSRRSIFRFLPRFLTSVLISRILTRQFEGFRSADKFVYFPLEFNEDGKRVVQSLVAAGGAYVPRYDATFEHLPRVKKHETRRDGSFHVYSIVRFLMRSTPDANFGYLKGNEIILTAASEFLRRHPNAVFHFFEKGEDVELAKAMCEEMEIARHVVWHPNLPFKEFAELISDADVCIDQVGDHWIGAGVYAMAMGVPLIANARRSVESGVWRENNPVFDCRTKEEIVSALSSLINIDKRIIVGRESKMFIEEMMRPSIVLRQIIFDEALGEKDGVRGQP